MKTIAIMNLKGGVGKTTTSATVAYILSERGNRILLLDADMQGNLSQSYSIPVEDGTSMLDLLETGVKSVTPTHYARIDMIPSDSSLMYADVDAIKDGGRCNINAIRDLRDAIQEDNDRRSTDGDRSAYDYILIDCPPSFSAACTAALTAADSVIIPVRLDAFSTAGMAELQKQIANMRRVNGDLTIDGILITQWTATPEEVQALAFLREKTSLPIYKTVIRYSKRVGAATFSRQPLPVYSPNSAAAIDYRHFVNELMEGGAQNA